MRQDTKMPANATEFAAPGGSPAGALPATAVSIRGLEHSYGELRTIERLDLEAAPHGVIGLVGPSGCGKSTLLELVCGLREPAAGRSRSAAPAMRRPARPLRLHAPARPAAALVLGDRQRRAGAAQPGRSQRARRGERAAALFERFGLAGFETPAPAELSGGMRQRVAFLRTLLAGKPVLALDEPFASLDAITRAEMQQWLAGALRGEPRTVVLVTHDVEEALYLSDRVAVLSARPARIVAELRAPAPRAADRDAAVTDPDFVAVRERAMRALRGRQHAGEALAPRRPARSSA